MVHKQAIDYGIRRKRPFRFPPYSMQIFLMAITLGVLALSPLIMESLVPKIVVRLPGVVKFPTNSHTVSASILLLLKSSPTTRPIYVCSRRALCERSTPESSGLVEFHLGCHPLRRLVKQAYHGASNSRRREAIANGLSFEDIPTPLPPACGIVRNRGTTFTYL